MAGKHSASAAGELEELVHDTVKFIGGVADKLWTAGTAAKDLLLDGEKQGDSYKSKDKRSTDWFSGNSDMDSMPFEDLDMLVRRNARWCSASHGMWHVPPLL